MKSAKMIQTQEQTAHHVQLLQQTLIHATATVEQHLVLMVIVQQAEHVQLVQSIITLELSQTDVQTVMERTVIQTQQALKTEHSPLTKTEYASQAQHAQQAQYA
jgi:hypothetical protein